MKQGTDRLAVDSWEQGAKVVCEWVDWWRSAGVGVKSADHAVKEPFGDGRQVDLCPSGHCEVQAQCEVDNGFIGQNFNQTSPDGVPGFWSERSLRSVQRKLATGFPGELVASGTSVYVW